MGHSSGVLQAHFVVWPLRCDRHACYSPGEDTILDRTESAGTSSVAQIAPGNSYFRPQPGWKRERFSRVCHCHECFCRRCFSCGTALIATFHAGFARNTHSAVFGGQRPVTDVAQYAGPRRSGGTCWRLPACRPEIYQAVIKTGSEWAFLEKEDPCHNVKSFSYKNCQFRGQSPSPASAILPSLALR